MHTRVNTVVIGAGQAGLATSYYLAQQNRPHIVVERRSIGDSWRNGRWDSFTLVTPNWMCQLPGFPYQGADPDGFLPRDEVVALFEVYARSFNAPIRTGVTITAVDPSPNTTGYIVATSDGTWEARNVVVATGLFQRPKLPPVAAQVPPDVLQLHSSQYRNPESLPPGAILVVGTGQSGAQIAEELHEAGRPVYLSVSRATRMPRRYRGLDQSRWLFAMMNGNFRTVDTLPSPRAKFAANPHLSGKNGGHDINLRRLGREGVVLVGRVLGAEDTRLLLADDLEENLRRADEAAAKFKQEVDAFIERTGRAAPPPRPDERDDVTLDMPAISPAALDLKAHSIRSVIWASGYQFDFSWVHLPWVDEDGYPIQQRGVTAFPGLYVVGLPWLHTVLSGLIFGVGPDAEHVARHMAEHDPTLGPVPLS